MKVHDVAQGSKEWFDVRLGIPTASQFDRILTPSKLKYASGASTYLNELLAEWMLGEPLDATMTDWMDRGTELEAEALRYWEFQRNADARQVGFCTNDAGTVGASPDALVDPNGGLEIKNRAAKNHVGFLLGDDPIPRGQVQGGIWICERDWWDVLSYNPRLPPVLIRVYRDEKYIKALSDAMTQFLDELEQGKQLLARLGKAGRVDGSDLKAKLELSVGGA